MLATVLRTEVAEEISIKIMDAFVTLKHYISDNLIEQKYINNLVLENHNLIKQNSKDIKIIFCDFISFFVYFYCIYVFSTLTLGGGSRIVIWMVLLSMNLVVEL